jgi:ABC-2 type transport system permease protein
MKAFIIKEMYHIFRDRRSMLILFGMPIVQVLIFGFAITNEIKDAGIAVLDQSKDVMSQRLVDKLVSSGYFNVVDNLESQEEIEPEFKSGKIKLAIVIGNAFEQKAQNGESAQVQLISDASDPNTANILTNYAVGIINGFQKAEWEQLKMPIEIVNQSRMYFNPELRSVFMFVPGTIAVILMLVSAMMTSISIAREKELGTMEILLVSPLRPVQIILGKVIPYVLLSFTNALMILLVSWLVFEMPVRGSMLLLLAESILFIVMSLSLGIFISTVSRTQQVAMMLSMFALMLPTILLSGFIFPIENMPLPLQIVSNLMPSRWFIVIVKGIMVKGVGLAFLWKETLIIVAMTLVFIALSVKKFKIRLA